MRIWGYVANVEAVALWLDLEKYQKAAELFELANLFEKASYCYHKTLCYEKAAEALHVGHLYDQLIIYLSLY